MTGDVPFSGAVIHGGQSSISITEQLEPIPKLAVQELVNESIESIPQRYERLKVLDSDSD